MSGSAIFDRLRPGLDPNDSSWVIVRTAADWAAAAAPHVAYNPARGGLELAPRARPELAADWLPLEPVTGAGGSLYRTDPSSDLLLVRGPCDAEFLPVEGVGGTGFATGRFNTPTGLATDARGRVYVADAGNARVQIIDPAKGLVVAVLADGLSMPVHVALGPCGTIYVADPGTGAIHAFGADFLPLRVMPLVSLDPRTGAPWIAPPEPRPLAVAVLESGAIVAFDPARAWLWHMTAAGEPLPAHPWFHDTLPEGWAPAPRRFDGGAELVVGPLDGGTHDLEWHRVLVSADLPEGTMLKAQTFAANSEDATPLAFAPQSPLAMPRAEADRRGGEYDRLVLADRQAWPLWRPGRLTRTRPRIAQLNGDGPSSSTALTLPADAAARVRTGDRLILTTPAGGTAQAVVADVSADACTVAASGPAAGFSAPTGLRLIRRDDKALPYGPLDLRFVVDPAAVGIVGVARDGKPEAVALPHELAAFLQPGDVVAFDGQPEPTRLEVLSLPDDPVTFQLQEPVPGDFSECSVALASTSGRLLVRESLPGIGALPPGSQVSVIQNALVETRDVPWVEAADTATGAGRQDEEAADIATVLWLTEPLASGSSADGITAEDWTNARFPEPLATDRGRYLWVRLELRGRGLPSPGALGPATVASATPLIRSLRVTGPRPSLLHWLPRLFSHHDPMDEPPGGNFLERFLALFEGQLTHMEAALDSVSRLLNPLAADPAWLEFVAGWLDLAFDPSWPVPRRRQLVIEGASLQAGRGTPAALERYLEIYTGAVATVTEAFRRRPPPPIQLGARGSLGVAPLGPDAGDSGRFAHRFKVSVSLPRDIDRFTAMSAVRAIIESMKPAHTTYVLDVGRGRAGRIGMDMAIGNIAIPGPGRFDPCACDPDAPPGQRPQPGHVPGGFRLGGRLGHGGVAETGVQGG